MPKLWSEDLGQFSNFKPDMRDVFIILGLILAGYGMWLYKPWMSLTVLGFILLGMGIYSYRKR